jgi:Acyl-CoA carboxylase epsilon subunit
LAVNPEGAGEPRSTPLVLIKGDATDEEVAALVAVVQGLASPSAAATDEPVTPRSTWASPARQVRTSHHAGPGGWRASALPR